MPIDLSSNPVTPEVAQVHGFEIDAFYVADLNPRDSASTPTIRIKGRWLGETPEPYPDSSWEPGEGETESDRPEIQDPAPILREEFFVINDISEVMAIMMSSLDPDADTVYEAVQTALYNAIIGRESEFLGTTVPNDE